MDYLGRPYSPDYDCLTLFEDVQRNVFHRTVDLPEHEQSVSARSKQFQQQWHQFFTPTDTPTDGDAALMVARKVHQHVGIVVRHDDDIFILHNLRSDGVCLHPLPVLEGRHSYRLENYYRYVQPNQQRLQR